MLNLFKKNIFLITITYTTFVYVICLVKVHDSVNVSISNIDKFIHFGIYFLFTLFWFFNFYGFNFIKNITNSIVKSSLFAFLTGVFIEILQQFFTKTRSADINDILANTFGILISVLVIILLKNMSLKSNK